MKKVFLLGLIEPDPDIRAQLQAVFLQAGYQIQLATSGGEAMAMFDPGNRGMIDELDLLITEYLLDEYSGLDIIKRVRGLKPTMQTLLMTSFDVNAWIDQAIADEIGSIIAKTKPLEIAELLYAAHALLTGDIFGLEKHLRPGTAVREFTVSRSSDKEAIIRTIAADVARLSPDGENSRDVVALALDEMISNALYGAPRNQAGGNRYPKGSDITLQPREEILVRCGTDGTLFGFSVTDRHGSLTRLDVLQALSRQINGSGLDEDRGGGGFYLIRSFVDRFVINIDGGNRTETIGLLYLPLNRETAETRNKSLLIFQIGGEGHHGNAQA